MTRADPSASLERSEEVAQFLRVELGDFEGAKWPPWPGSLNRARFVARAACDRSRRTRSGARRLAATVIQAPGLLGTPSRGHAATASMNASCTASSAS